MKIDFFIVFLFCSDTYTIKELPAAECLNRAESAASEIKNSTNLEDYIQKKRIISHVISLFHFYNLPQQGLYPRILIDEFHHLPEIIP